jgi:hypothetical protein
MTEAINSNTKAQEPFARVVGSGISSNDMPDADRFCTNCGYREPREGEAVVDFTKLYGR